MGILENSQLYKKSSQSFFLQIEILRFVQIEFLKNLQSSKEITLLVTTIDSSCESGFGLNSNCSGVKETFELLSHKFWTGLSLLSKLDEKGCWDGGSLFVNVS